MLSEKQQKNFDKFISKATSIHGQQYDYSLVCYENCKKSINIRCIKHDIIFSVTPDTHINNKQCCNLCVKNKHPQRMPLESVIYHAKLKHGDTYIYDNIQRNGELITIICKIHGEFTQNLFSHIYRGHGCQKCKKCNFVPNAGKTKIKMVIFLNKSILVHGDTYDYSLVNYINSTTKVKIICRIHGPFEQCPYSHLTGTGCPLCARQKCSITKTYTKEIFITKAQEVHGEKYNYSLVNYINSETKVIIICEEHGQFEQIPHSHLQKAGCPKCALDVTIKRNKLLAFTNEKFIEKANIVHNNEYTYPLLNYINNTTKIKIMCNIHGEYKQTPASHLNGTGCILCGRDKTTKALTCSTEDFIEKANNMHKNIYEYKRTRYINSAEKVIITCKKHGDYKQQAGSHLRGCGCPKCIPSGYSKIACEWLEYMAQEENIYIQHAMNEGEFKIEGVGKVDGYCKETNTVMEYLGCLWHGHPECYDLNIVNRVTKVSMKTLYENTIKRNELIKELGYNLVYIWECDYLKLKKERKQKK